MKESLPPCRGWQGTHSLVTRVKEFRAQKPNLTDLVIFKLIYYPNLGRPVNTGHGPTGDDHEVTLTPKSPPAPEAFTPPAWPCHRPASMGTVSDPAWDSACSQETRPTSHPFVAAQQPSEALLRGPHGTHVSPCQRSPQPLPGALPQDEGHGGAREPLGVQPGAQQTTWVGVLAGS